MHHPLSTALLYSSLRRKETRSTPAAGHAPPRRRRESRSFAEHLRLALEPILGRRGERGDDAA